MQPDAGPSLYDRLGRAHGIATVVDDFVDRLRRDDRLNKNPAVDEAHHRISPAGLKYLMTELVCWAAGGPQQYTGRPMRDTHRHLGITEDEWVSFMDDLHQSLARFHVPKDERTELTAIVEGTKDAIVVTSLPAAVNGR